jgi:hypothetical protein
MTKKINYLNTGNIRGISYFNKYIKISDNFILTQKRRGGRSSLLFATKVLLGKLKFSISSPIDVNRGYRMLS